MIDPKLKTKLDEAIEKAYEQAQSPCPMGNPKGTQGDVKFAKRATFVCRNRKFTLPKGQKTEALVFAKVVTNLVNARNWGAIERALAQEALERIIADLFRKRQRAAEDEKQGCLPGYEYLPARIQAGRQSVLFGGITVLRFLAYKSRYEQRAVKDQRVLEDLRRLAETVGPLAATEPETILSEALKKLAPPVTGIHLAIG